MPTHDINISISQCQYIRNPPYIHIIQMYRTPTDYDRNLPITVFRIAAFRHDKSFFDWKPDRRVCRSPIIYSIIHVYDNMEIYERRHIHVNRQFIQNLCIYVFGKQISLLIGTSYTATYPHDCIKCIRAVCFTVVGRAKPFRH